MTKELLFTVTAADCDWQYLRGTGPGGQKRNKTESKVRCVHRASGAVGESDLTRSQHENKKIAFRKMAESREFRVWHKIECARRMGEKISVEEAVDQMMADVNLRVEGKKDQRWVPIAEAQVEEKE